MPTFKLRKHKSSSCDDDVVINRLEFPDLKLKDFIEIKPAKPANYQDRRLILQIRKWSDNSLNPANTISIKDSITHHLKPHSDVLVEKVNKDEVLVDSIEICFSNAYLARSYMWGLKNYLNNRCVFQNQKLEYLSIRSQINEIWSQGKEVYSGYTDENTKIVFRSASSLVYLFIQMSSEMWDYDINGDLYCEKAINGFLTDLFDTWRKNDCSHDITIILFSRTFYEAESLDEFPAEMKGCLQVDSKNRFYEDYYRVAFQNDRFDLHDWNANLTSLKSIFNQYQKEVINRHANKYCNVKIPRAYNSNASQGNFLEVLNMSLNVFEKHYFDRSFDRTGQLSVVVSPGVGVFEVDFEMTNLTKQRIIDNGIGSDLVCLGEQPMHTVPLLKLSSKSNSSSMANLATCDVYNIPHWINLSFYSSTNQTYHSNFIPRIKLPTIDHSKNEAMSICNTGKHQSSASNNKKSGKKNTQFTFEEDDIIEEVNENKKENQDENSTFSPPLPDLFDFDDYDSQVFTPNSMLSYQSQAPNSRYKRKSGTRIGAFMNQELYKTRNVESSVSQIDRSNKYDKNDDGYRQDGVSASYSCHQYINDMLSRSYSKTANEIVPDDMSISISTTNKHSNRQKTSSDFGQLDQLTLSSPKQHFIAKKETFKPVSEDAALHFERFPLKPECVDDFLVCNYNSNLQRYSKIYQRPKALINPFDPSHMTIKLTPNRRRWTHVFPQGPTGTFMQQHIYQPIHFNKHSTSSAPYLANVSIGPLTEINDDGINNRMFRSSVTLSSPIPQKSPTILKSQNFSFSNIPPRDGSNRTSDDVFVQSIANGGGKSAVVSNETVRFAWCASGEQEWTPAITRGVDWKSLTMPACLPLTTDFFPSKSSLQNDYVICEYTIDSSCIHSRYSLIEVYRELVCQRLQKGFQIILLPRQKSFDQTNPSDTSINNSTSNSSKTAPLSPNSQKNNNNSISSSATMTNQSSSTARKLGVSLSKNSAALDSIQSRLQSGEERERTDYTMSIGRIFHRLTLNGSTISVTQYRPRHPYPTIKIVYWYRFRAPFHETYEKSLVHFNSEKLENYNWNYLDHYISTRGETFKLRNSLKFWRFRILVLPSQVYLRRISHDDDDIDGDCCHGEETSGRNSANLSNNIIKVTSNNRDIPANNDEIATTRSTNNSRRQSQEETRYDNFYLEYADDEKSALAESFIKLVEIINKTRRASIARTSATSSNSVSSVSVSSSIPNSSTHNNFSNYKQHQYHQAGKQRNVIQIDDASPVISVTINDNNTDSESLEFVPINMDIDSSLRDVKRAEWVHVMHHNHYHVEQAFELVIKWMVASGVGIAEMVQNWSRRAGNSRVHLVPIPWEPFALPDSGKADPLRCPLYIPLCLEELTELSSLKIQSFQDKILRRFGFVRFHDLISTESFGPQYIHLTGFAFVGLMSRDTSAAMKATNSSLAVDDDDGRNEQLSPKGNVDDVDGCALTTSLGRSRLNNKSALNSNQKKFQLEHQDTTASSPREDYITTRHISAACDDANNSSVPTNINADNEDDADKTDASLKVEFVWSWNYMLTKRWRSTSTLNEGPAVLLMKDFKDFCQNHNNRLVAFFAEIQETL